MEMIEEVVGAEARMLAEEKEILSGELSLIERILSSYASIGGFINESSAELSEGLVAAMAFLLAARHRLLAATLSLLRGSQSDSFIHTRIAIENAAFGRRVLLHPDLGSFWLHANDSEASYKQYRAKFPTKDLFPKEHKPLRELYKIYDFCSKQSHPTLHSFSGRLKVNSKLDSHVMRLFHFDTLEQPPFQRRANVVWLADAHFGILRVFGEGLATLPKFSGLGFSGLLSQIETVLTERKAQLKPSFEQIVAANPRPQADS